MDISMDIHIHGKPADFSLKMHQKRLAAGRPEPLGELTAFPRPPS